MTHPLSLYEESSSIEDRIYYLKHYEKYDPAFPLNPKMELILNDTSNNRLDGIIDAILYTRSINGGRGLRDLTYSYLWTLQQKYPLQSVFLLYRMMEYQAGRQIGCWRDVRAYADFVSKHSAKGRDDPMLSPILGLYNNQLFKDREAMGRNGVLSYAAKWVPRERKCGWMFEKLVDLWIFADPESKATVSTAVGQESAVKARHKCKMNYRKLVSKLNTLLDTTEIKECAREWGKIDVEKIPVGHLYLNRANLENRGLKLEHNGRNVIGGIPSWKLVKKMLQMVKAENRVVDNRVVDNRVADNRVEIDKLDAEWANREWRDERDSLPHIVMVDVSAPMYEDGAKSLYTAIGLGCEMAAKSQFGRRVLAFSPKPYWVDLENCPFSEMVKRIISSIWIPMNYLDEAFSIVLDGILYSDMTPEEVSGIRVVLITNRPDAESLPENIVETWKEAGIHKFGRPFLLDGRNFEKIGV